MVATDKASLPSDLMVIVNSTICEWRHDVIKDLGTMGAWVNNLVIQTPQEAKVKKKRCDVCGSKEDVVELQLHHIAGKKHDYRAVTVCAKKCHKELSLRQNLWDSRWLRGSQPDLVRNAFFLLGLREVLLLKADATGNGNYQRLADAFVWDIARLLRGSVR